MKQNPTCSRSSKPPPARSSCSNPSRLRPGQGNIDTQVMASTTLQVQESHKLPGEIGGVPAGMGEHTFPMPTAAGMLSGSPKDVSECLSGWLMYLQMLNGLCGAGSRLSHSLGALVQDPTSSCHMVATQCQAAWEELVKATTVASSAVKTQVLSALHEINNIAGDADAETQLRMHESNQQVLCGSLMTFINLHYQFCAACCEYLGSVSSNCCHGNDGSGQGHDPECSVGKLQQCFNRLYSPSPPGRQRARSPWHLTLCPLQSTQRRWSEAAAVEAGDATTPVDPAAARRWSMPWDTSRQIDSKLAVPHDRSRSTTPESGWHSSLASQDELQDVIQLLSCRPTFTQSTQLYHPGASQHLPGVTLTACPYDGPQDGGGYWGDNGGMESGGPSRRGSNSPCSHRGSWQAPDMYMLDADVLASRKSSSSTDSSSSYSLHSHTRSSTGSEGSAEIRAHLYSMWSGSDLSFNKVPESSEPPEPPSPGSVQQRFPQADSSNQTFYSDAK